MSGILNLSLTQLTKAYRNKSVSVSQVVDQVLAQQAVMSSLNAFIGCHADDRIQKATQRAQQRQNSNSLLSELDGVPFVVKDNYCTTWATTTCASNMLRRYTAPYTAAVVTRLEEAGAIIIGKGNMDEFGMGSGGTNSAFGAVQNVYRSGRPYTVPGLEDSCGGLQDGGAVASGGSSGGSAVAVAAGMAYGGLGSDTGGSVRNPASFCGLVGLKPSYGLLSRSGLVSLVNSLDTPGVLARTCEDCAAIMTVLVGHDDKDSTSLSTSFGNLSPTTSSLDGLTVGLPSQYYCQGLHPLIIGHWKTLSDAMAAAGAKVVAVSLPHTSYAPSCYTVLNTCEVASNFTRFTGVQYGHSVQSTQSMESQLSRSRGDGLSSVVRDRVLAGNFFLLKANKSRYYQRAVKVRRLISDEFNTMWSNGVDVVLTPTTLFPAPRTTLFDSKNLSEITYMQDLCTSPANLAGLPALAIPVGYTTDTTTTSSQHMTGATSSQHSTGATSSQHSTGAASGQPSAGAASGQQNDAADVACNLSQSDICGTDQIAGLPLSLQLIGPHGSDSRLLQIGKWIELTVDVPRIILQDPL